MDHCELLRADAFWPDLPSTGYEIDVCDRVRTSIVSLYVQRNFGSYTNAHGL